MPPCLRCKPAVIMMAAALLTEHPHPTAVQVDAALRDHTCWCYRWGELRAIILAAATELNSGGQAPAPAG